MAETARIHDAPPGAAATPRPDLQLVHGSAPEQREPRVGRGAAIGYVVGFVVSTVVITVIGTLGGMGFAQSLGLGAFVGVWGGGGFGFMMGGTLPFALFLDAEHARAHPPTNR